MFGNHGLRGLPEEGAHEKSPKCLGGNLGDFGEFCKGLDLVFFKVFDSMGDTFGVVGFGFGFRQRRNGDDEVSFGDVDIVN